MNKVYFKPADILSKVKLKLFKGVFICDNCKKEFNGSDILLEICNNIQFSSLISNPISIKKNNNTYYLVSPCCKETHLFGFDVK